MSPIKILVTINTGNLHFTGGSNLFSIVNIGVVKAIQSTLNLRQYFVTHVTTQNIFC
jgi:hypothetical protein